jgi:hypothetical protein
MHCRNEKKLHPNVVVVLTELRSRRMQIGTYLGNLCYTKRNPVLHEPFQLYYKLVKIGTLKQETQEK